MSIRGFHPLTFCLLGCLLIFGSASVAMEVVLPGAIPDTAYTYNNYYVLPGLSENMFFTTNGAGCEGEDGDPCGQFTLILEVPDSYDDAVNIFFFDPGCKNDFDACGANGTWDTKVRFSIRDMTEGKAVPLLLEGTTKKPIFTKDYNKAWSGMYSFVTVPGHRYRLKGVLLAKSDEPNADEKNGFRIALGPIFDETPLILDDGDDTGEEILALTASAGGKGKRGGSGGGSGSGTGSGSGGGGGMPEGKGPGQEETEAPLVPVLKVYLDEHAEKLFANSGEALYFVELPDPDVSGLELPVEPATLETLENTLRGISVKLRTYDLNEEEGREIIRCIHMPTGIKRTRRNDNIPSSLTMKKEVFPHIGLNDYLDALTNTEDGDEGDDGGPSNDNSATNGKRPDNAGDDETSDEPPVLPPWGLAAVRVTLANEPDEPGNEWSLWTRQICDTDMMETGREPLIMPEPPFILAPRGLSASLWRWYFETALIKLEGTTGGSGSGHPREGGNDVPHIREGTVPSPEELLSFLEKLNYGQESVYDYGGGFDVKLGKEGDEIVDESFYFTFDTSAPIEALQKAKNILSFNKVTEIAGDDEPSMDNTSWGVAAKDPQVRCRVQMFALVLNGIWNREMFNKTPYTPISDPDEESATAKKIADHFVDGGIWGSLECEPWVYLPRELVLWLYGDTDGYYLKSMTQTVSDFLQGYSEYGADETRGLFHFLEILNDNPVGWYPLQVPNENTSCGG